MITPDRPVRAGDVAAHYDELDVYYRKSWGEHVHHGLWTTGVESPEEAARQLTCLARGTSSHSIFLLTVGRILRAYRTGAMRYGLFVLQAP